MDLLPDRLTPLCENLACNFTPIEVTPELVPITAIYSPPPPFFPLSQLLETHKVEDIAALSTIDSFEDFLHIKELVLNSFPTTEPSTGIFSWKQYFLTQTLQQFGEQQYHRCLEVENENAGLNKQLEKNRNLPKRHRGCLPSSGQAW